MNTPRTVTDHIVTPADAQIRIEVTDAPGSGRANHRYEITGPSFYKNPSSDSHRNSLSRVWDGIDRRINRKDSKPMTGFRTGELVVHSPSITEARIADAEITQAKSFIPIGWDAVDSRVTEGMITPDKTAPTPNTESNLKESKNTAESITILFQQGPIPSEGLNGVTQEVLLAIVIDRLRSFQTGPFPCSENQYALQHCQEALHWLQQRTLKRIQRGVEGKLEK